MSGHSKWATIKRQKGSNDAKKGQLFTKLSNAITIAVREGGGNTDPEFNFKLRMTIDKARVANMPKDSIERAIEKAKGGQAADLAEVIYEAFAPGGVSVMVQAFTDNKQRTVAEVKNILEKNGASLGAQGSVAYLFEHRGELVLNKNEKSFEEIFEIAAEAGAEDIEESGNEVYIYTQSGKLAEVKKALESNGIAIESAELVYYPKSTVDVTDKLLQEKLVGLLEKIDDLSDVQKVFTTANFTF